MGLFMRALYIFILPFLLLYCAEDNVESVGSSTSQITDYDVEERLQELGIGLRLPSPPTANFVRTSRIGNIVFLSGHGPDTPGGGRIIGKVGMISLWRMGKKLQDWQVFPCYLHLKQRSVI